MGGAKLIAEIQKGSEVIVELDWIVPKDTAAAVDMWMNSADPVSQAFFSDFVEYATKLNYYMQFTPHFAVFSMAQMDAWNELCLDSTAKYCSVDPDDAGDITGKDVLLEDIRQLCIHTNTKVEPENDFETAGGLKVAFSFKYWQYVQYF